MKSNLLPAFLILLGSILVSLPLIKPGLHVIHDDQQIARLYLFDKVLKTSQFPVRWVDELGFGYGYPLFVFYPPLVYMIGELFHILGFSFISSVKLVFFVSILASGLSMYVLAKEFWGKLPALVSAFFYMYVPYRAVDIYVRGALAESFSFVWLPLILLTFYKLTYTKKVIYLYLSSIFLALLMITHNLIFLPFMLILPLYLLLLIIKSDDKRLTIRNQFLATTLAFGLSAFFWLPALLEKKFTIVDQLLLVNLANYNIHFVYPQQLWNWPWGFGGSASGLADGLSFKIGKIHILTSAATLILSIIFLHKSQSKKLLVTRYQLPVTFFVLFLLSAFMTTFYSKFIWDLVPPLGYLQFPWRFLTFTSLFTSILAGAFIFALRLPILKLIASTILILLVIIPNLKLFKPQTYRLNLTDDIATSKEAISWDVSHSSFEYLPKGVPIILGNLGTNVIDIRRSDISKPEITTNPNEAKILDTSVKPHRLDFHLEAIHPSTITVSTFNFPGWQAKIDNKIEKIDDRNRFKHISLRIPAGFHSVSLEFKDTLIRKIGNSISLLSIIFLISFLIVNDRNFRHRIN